MRGAVYAVAELQVQQGVATPAGRCSTSGRDVASADRRPTLKREGCTRNPTIWKRPPRLEDTPIAELGMGAASKLKRP
jgi:hypothetical protein